MPSMSAGMPSLFGTGSEELFLSLLSDAVFTHSAGVKENMLGCTETSG